MSKLTRQEVLKLARLSRLRLTDVEIASFQEELGSILDYVQMLSDVDVSGLDPTYQVSGLQNVSRPDEIVKYQASPDDLLKIAPAVQDRQYKVKRVIS